jgi:hypothetical protein
MVYILECLVLSTVSCFCIAREQKEVADAMIEAFVAILQAAKSFNATRATGRQALSRLAAALGEHVSKEIISLYFLVVVVVDARTSMYAKGFLGMRGRPSCLKALVRDLHTVTAASQKARITSQVIISCARAVRYRKELRRSG